MKNIVFHIYLGIVEYNIGAEYFQGYGSPFYSGDDQNTKNFIKNTIFIPQFLPGDVKIDYR